MERTRSTTLIAGVFGLVFTLYGSASMAGMAGTAHDLTNLQYTTDFCNVCHTPYTDAARSSTGAPLWSRTTTTTTFTPYQSTGTLNAALGQLGSVSRLCLSCHDGTISIDSFRGAVGTSTIGATGFFGSQDHPISFVYESVVASDGGLNSSASAYGAGVLMGTLATTATVECTSCHDVHNAGNFSPLLRINNVDSGLCLICHLK